ncbi:Calmodulin-binding transcription activator 1 [Armadillidium nasatum]|uniref:Calmodulin-binding transcription activator 1 n=1 Tax=Armadillidium nasatum TaxID=96803 RepID=A0A5N5TJE0_9CRUS|nr:Calmodulin-binding transcription activator 1 [Armadillidium nasatum]
MNETENMKIENVSDGRKLLHFDFSDRKGHARIFIHITVFSEEEPDINNEIEISENASSCLLTNVTAETVEAIVGQLMEKQRVARAAAASASKASIECACGTGVGGEHSKHCTHHPLRRLTIAKLPQQSQPQQQQQQQHHHPNHPVQTAPTHHHQNNHHQQQQQQQQQQQPQHTHHPHSHPHHSHHPDAASAAPAARKTLMAHPTSSDHDLNQGGGGLLILNSGSHTGGHGHSQHPLAAPFTLTSYFGQPHVVTSTANGGRLPHAHVLHSLHHQQHPHSVHSVHHQQPMQIQYPHHQQQHNHHSNNQHHHHSTVLVKRESKEDAVESLRLDVTNGNLTMDSGTFASLVSSLEASESQNKGGQRESSLVGDSGSIKAELAADMSIVKEELFVDTLTLSPEDIQKTLSANLPPHNPIPKSPHSADDNPMDFIDSNMPSAEDDVLANLDAFDMLSDFPDLEHYDTSPPDNLNSNHSNSSASSSTNVSGKSVTNQSQQTLRIDYRENSSNISDYSPEWAYPEGGVKVLVTGPWYSSTSPYTVLFDGVPTPTTLVQAGVLRCYCPAHEAGLVTLQVACDGFVISNSVIFEYKKPPVDANSVKEEEGVQEQDEHLLKFTLLQRLESIETRVQTQSDSNGQDSSTAYENDLMLHKSSYFQDRVVLRCQRLSRLPWLSGANSLASLPPTKESPLRKGQTILHLAARLGYTRLIVCLLRWREENASLALELEVDALRKDGKGRTPLSWACLEGHKDSALILYRWNPQVIKSTDNQGMTPLKLAEINGHDNLLEELTHREEENHKSSSQCSSLSQLRKSSSSSHVSSSFSSSSSSSHSLNSASNDLSVTSVTSDGFLRPSPRRSDLRKHRHLSVDFPIGGETDIGRGGNSSPALSWSEGLKRGRIIKRPSVDSGINLVSVDSFKRASLDSGLDILQKHSRNVSCCQTPLEDSSPLEDTSDDVNFPLHFDYFRGNGEKAPKDSEPEEELRQSFEGGSDSTAADMSASDDSRVFTLAEQIIAAIPERIKGDEEDVTDLLSPCLTEPPSTDLSMEVILDESPDSNAEFNFEFSDIMSYRYMDVSTPSSSLSPASSTCLPSPASFPLDSPSPPPTTADFSEFFQASTRDFSKDFSNLTLSDQEQRELYEAAKIIQKAYRLYKGRKRQQAEKDKERQAAVLIQNYYRRYKQYAYFRQMSKAATLIQTQFRSYCETKRFKKSQETANKYNLRSSREGTPVPNLKRSYSQRRQHQAARKIQQFMRQTKQKLQRERAQAAEREKSGQGSAPHPIGPPNLGARRAPSPVLPHSLPLRGVPGVHSSELSRRVTDPLLSATAHLPHRTEEEKTGEFESL